jgi:hypothetical protein
MFTAYIVLTIVAAAMTAFSAGSVFFRAQWVVQPLADYGVPRSWWPWLGTAKAVGAIGMAAGLAVPPIGVAAGIGLVLYYAGAVTTVARARWYSHLPFPMVYVAPVIASLVLGFNA